MRKYNALKGLFLTLFFVIMVTVFTSSPASAVTILDADVENASDDCVMLGVEGSYVGGMKDALKRINQIRKEACDEGVIDPRDNKRKLTPDDYIPIKWSKALESIARLRAAESSVTMNHRRLNNKPVLNVSYDGITASAETLAWFWRGDSVRGVNMWYEEKSDWINQTDAETGHYTVMINPDIRYVGLGLIGCSQYTMAGEFTDLNGSSEEDCLPEAYDIIQSVEAKKSNVEKFYLDGSEAVLLGNEEEYIPKAKTVFDGVSGDLYLLGNLKYESSDENVATISSSADGIYVRGLKEGTAKITATLNGIQILSKDIVVEVKHSYVPEWMWHESYEGYAFAEANFTCKTCGKKVEGVSADVKSKTTVKPTCNKKGETKYTATVILDGTTYTDTRTQELDVDLSDGHEYVENITKATPDKDGYRIKKCKRCGDVWSAEDIPRIERDDVLLSSEYFKYNGHARKPSVSVYVYDSWLGYEKLANKNYTLKYANNLNAGSGKVTITFIGDKYAGSITKKFTIAKASVKIKVSTAKKSVKYKKLKKKAQRTSKVSVSGAKTGYTYKKLSGSSSRLSISKSGGKITVKKGTKKGTYSIRIKVTTKSNKNYKAASKTVTVKVKVK